MKQLVVVEKRRTSYNYQKTEVVLDYITDLGWFIEIESKGDFASIDEAKDHVFAVAKEIGVIDNQQDKRGYPYLLLEKQGLL